MSRVERTDGDRRTIRPTRTPAPVKPAPVKPAPETGIGLAWAILSRRSATVNMLMIAVVIAAAVIGLVLALGPTGVGVVAGAVGARKGAQSVARWRGRKVRERTQIATR